MYSFRIPSGHLFDGDVSSNADKSGSDTRIKEIHH